jgi:hypothetical protein
VYVRNIDKRVTCVKDMSRTGANAASNLRPRGRFSVPTCDDSDGDDKGNGDDGERRWLSLIVLEIEMKELGRCSNL